VDHLRRLSLQYTACDVSQLLAPVPFIFILAPGRHKPVTAHNVNISEQSQLSR
jgi:hypothetical protein